MPRVRSRGKKEAAIAKAIAREFNKAKLALVGLIQELDPWMVDVAPEFWAEHEVALRGAITPLMSGVYITQAETLLAEFSFLGVEWGLVNEAASDWARTYTYDLVTNLIDTSRRTLQKLIPRYFDEKWTLVQLRTALTPTFGGLRAEMIARTEVTRAASEGEIGTVQILGEDGIKMVAFWHTNMDEIVCEICRPLNERPMDGFTDNRPWWIHPDSGDNYGPPPAHPNCRCGMGYQMVE